MAGKKESSAPWRQISIVIRADILEQARQQKIDVSEACNRTLAERLGIDFRQQKIPDGIVFGTGNHRSKRKTCIARSCIS